MCNSCSASFQFVSLLVLALLNLSRSTSASDVRAARPAAAMARANPPAQPDSRRLPSLDSTYSSPYSTIERSYPPVPLDLETVSTAPVYAKFANSHSQSQIGVDNPDQKPKTSISFLQVETNSPVPSITNSVLREQQGRDLPLPLKQNSKNGHKAGVPSLTIKSTDDP